MSGSFCSPAPSECIGARENELRMMNDEMAVTLNSLPAETFAQAGTKEDNFPRVAGANRGRLTILR